MQACEAAARMNDDDRRRLMEAAGRPFKSSGCSPRAITPGRWRSRCKPWRCAWRLRSREHRNRRQPAHGRSGQPGPGSLTSGPRAAGALPGDSTSKLLGPRHPGNALHVDQPIGRLPGRWRSESSPASVGENPLRQQPRLRSDASQYHSGPSPARELLLRSERPGPSRAGDAVGLEAASGILSRAGLDIANTLNRLGMLYLKRGSFAESRKRFPSVAEDLYRLSGPEHVESARVLVNLGVWNIAKNYSSG